ncbi:hypothetical protein Agabi119p4_8497 [Agaricus bisporus var. burnettii]|uniref:Uncharacterized protein n=1 Tax=Agaricus bisporus var. burnettii TaxID=192524 RepID=A0A8H7C781_AGABI|nr:hypothetical protein Agabi119p4_8497 [Agaricus bisporus var. burnettii]
MSSPLFAYINHICLGQLYQHHLKSIDLAEFLHIKKTIPGATYDSSARDPLPRSHFGTRWPLYNVDAAGVGKSAIMQDVTSSPLSVPLYSSVFFSVDGTKAIITVSYRLAVKSKSYCQFIKREVECP